MNIAIVRHVGIGATNRKFAFSLPDGAVIGKGTLLTLDTQYGENIGELVDSVNADGSALGYILRSLGTDVKHLKPVKSILVKKGLEQLRAENRYEEGGDAYIRICREREELKAKLIAAETERDMLKSKLSRILKCCGVGE